MEGTEYPEPLRRAGRNEGKQVAVEGNWRKECPTIRRSAQRLGIIRVDPRPAVDESGSVDLARPLRIVRRSAAFGSVGREKGAEHAPRICGRQ